MLGEAKVARARTDHVLQQLRRGPPHERMWRTGLGGTAESIEGTHKTVVEGARKHLDDLRSFANEQALKGAAAGVDPTAVQAAVDTQTATNTETQAVIDALNAASA